MQGSDETRHLLQGLCTPMSPPRPTLFPPPRQQHQTCDPTSPPLLHHLHHPRNRYLSSPVPFPLPAASPHSCPLIPLILVGDPSLLTFLKSALPLPILRHRKFPICHFHLRPLLHRIAQRLKLLLHYPRALRSLPTTTAHLPHPHSRHLQYRPCYIRISITRIGM